MNFKLIIFTATLMVSTAVYAETADKETNSLPQPRSALIMQRSEFEPHLRVNGYAFYAFDDKVDSYYSSTNYFKGKIKGGFQWGGGLEYMIAPSQGVEISYLRLDTEAPLEYFNNSIKFTTFDVATNYIMLGGNRYFPTGGKVEPYAGAQLGVAIFNVKNPDSGNSDNATKFAWSIKAGLNIWASEKVGLKLQTGLISAVQAAGGGLYFGPGGIGGGINTYSTFYQFYIGGGLSFDLAK